MLPAQINTILFDLDGTLLPMEVENFTNIYFKLLAKKAVPYGFEPKPLVDAVWGGTKAMMQNDGSVKNIRRFWAVFGERLGEKALALKDEFDAFYREEFHGVRAATEENPLAKKLIEGLKAKGYTLALATNPLFPLDGVKTRLSWISLSAEDFSHVTSYENSSYCKPNPQYFSDILKQLGKKPEECLMVGNDAREDLGAVQAGIRTCLITDCLDNPDGIALDGVETFSFADFVKEAGV